MGQWRSKTIEPILFLFQFLIAEGLLGHFATRVRYQLPEDAEIRLPNLVHHEINDGLIEVLNDLDIKQVRRMKSNDINAIEDRLSLVLSKRRTPLPITQVKLESARILLKQ